MRILALGGVVGPLIFSLVALTSASLRPDYDRYTQFISELGATGTVNASLMNYAGFLPFGLLLVGMGFAVQRALPPTRPSQIAAILTMLFGVGTIASGFISCDVGCPQTGGSLENFLHDKIGPLAFLSVIGAAAILGIHLRRFPEWRRFAGFSLISSVVALVCLVGLFLSLESRSFTGLWQRLMLAAIFLWTAVLGIRAFDRAAPEEDLST
jgi:hypothetical membrane protein